MAYKILLKIRGWHMERNWYLPETI
jgi:hypothetical protein